MARNFSKLATPERRQRLLEAALAVAERLGFQGVASPDVAASAACSDGFVRQMLPAGSLPDEILREAIRVGNLLVLAQGLAVRHPIALAAPPDMRVRAAEVLMGEP